ADLHPPPNSGTGPADLHPPPNSGTGPADLHPPPNSGTGPADLHPPPKLVANLERHRFGGARRTPRASLSSRAIARRGRPPRPAPEGCRTVGPRPSVAPTRKRRSRRRAAPPLLRPGGRSISRAPESRR